jgi:hypothetical protein
MVVESPPKEPRLPENTTAQQLLEKYSEKARAEIAQQQGISAAAFNTYLNARARQERVAASISQAKEILRNKPASGERNENEICAEQAVIFGLKQVLQRFSPEDLAEEVIDALERQAYAAVEEFWELPLGFRNTLQSKKVEQMFDRIVAARTQNGIAKSMRAGMTAAEARKAAVESLQEQAKRTNLNFLRHALEYAAAKFAEGYVAWRGRETSNLTELQSIVDGYGNRPLTTQESKLFAAFVKAAKSHYFGGTRSDFSGTLQKYRRMMSVIFVAYRNRGPHRRTVSNVSGPVEMFTSHQSGHEAGYRRVGKARPHRDPSGGNGEKW